MTQPRPLLVTGFGPFPGIETNPSAEVARRLDGRTLGAWQVTGRVLDTSWSRAWPQLAGHVRTTRPDMLVMTGVAMKRAAVQLETRALNRRGLRADVDGVCPTSRALVSGGPDALRGTLPRLADAETSDDAGDYLCNAVFYLALQALSVPRCGFVHLPPDGVEATIALIERLCA